MEHTKQIDMELLSLWLKNLIWTMWAWLLSFITPVAPFLVAAMLLVLADMVTGISAARNRGETINSKGMRRTIRKVIGYFTAILCVHLCDRVFGVKEQFGFDLAMVTAGLVALAELKSVLENVSSYTGINIWQGLVDALPDIKLKDLFTKKTPK